jgi:hypothetical protein
VYLNPSRTESMSFIHILLTNLITFSVFYVLAVKNVLACLLVRNDPPLISYFNLFCSAHFLPQGSAAGAVT